MCCCRDGLIHGPQEMMKLSSDTVCSLTNIPDTGSKRNKTFVTIKCRREVTKDSEPQ